MRSIAAIACAGLAFLAGIGVGAFVIAPRSDRPVADSASGPLGADVAGGARDDASRQPSPEDVGTSSSASAASTSSGGSSAPGAAASPLASRMADFDRTLRRRITQAARERLGADPPAADVDDAVRLAEEALELTPASYAETIVRRENVRRALGALADPWDVVIEARTGATLHVERRAFVDAREPERKVVGATTSPVDTKSGVEMNEANAARWIGGAAVPPGKVAVLETVVIDAVLGVPQKAQGHVSIGGEGPIPDLYDQGSIHRRYVGVAVLSDGWGVGIEPSLDIVYGAARVAFHGRLIDASETRTLRRARFHLAPEGDDGYLKSGRIRLQVVAGHVGGNPCSISLLGTTNGPVSLSPTPVWDESLALAKVSDARAFAESIGVIPPGKALRVRRVDWRARFGAVQSTHGDLRVRVRGQDVVVVKRTDLADPRPADDRYPEETRSGTWTGDLVITGGHEEDTSLECSYFVMGEAIFDGEIVDEPK